MGEVIKLSMLVKTKSAKTNQIIFQKKKVFEKREIKANFTPPIFNNKQSQDIRRHKFMLRTVWMLGTTLSELVP